MIAVAATMRMTWNALNGSGKALRVRYQPKAAPQDKAAPAEAPKPEMVEAKPPAPEAKAEAPKAEKAAAAPEQPQPKPKPKVVPPPPAPSFVDQAIAAATDPLYLGAGGGIIALGGLAFWMARRRRSAQARR